jgi:hypothetical protein
MTMFGELAVRDFARTLFSSNDELKGIRLEYAPWPEGETWK